MSFWSEARLAQGRSARSIKRIFRLTLEEKFALSNKYLHLDWTSPECTQREVRPPPQRQAPPLPYGGRWAALGEVSRSVTGPPSQPVRRFFFCYLFPSPHHVYLSFRRKDA